MICIMCGGNLEHKNITYKTGQGDNVLIVKNVPALVCSQCGESYFNNDVCSDMEKIEAEARNSATEMYITTYRTVTAKVA